MIKRVFVAAAILFLFACRTHGDEVAGSSPYTLLVDTTAYALADTAHLVFVNDSDTDVYVDFLCSTTIERHDKDAWVEAFRPDCSHIRVRPVIVAAGESAVGSFVIGPLASHASAHPDYRICVIVSHASTSTAVCSPALTIAPHR